MSYVGNIEIIFSVDNTTNLTFLCNDNLVSQDYFNEGTHKINFEHELQKDVEIKIVKKGAKLLKDKKVDNQLVLIKKLILNGINCLEGKHGTFDITNNVYIENHTLETNSLYLDGIWKKQIKFFDYFATVPYKIDKCNLLDKEYNLPAFKNVDIALFGASFLENNNLDLETRWFYKTAKILNCTYQHYSVPGGSNQQVFSLYNAWQKQCKAKIVIFAFTSFSRLFMLVNNKIQFFNMRKKLKDMLVDDIDEVSGKSIKQITDILCWEGLETIMSIQIPLLYIFFTNIEKKSKVYIMPTIFAERKFFSETILNKFLLPGWDYNQPSQAYPTKLDNQKYFDKLKKENIIKEMGQYI